jgi:hypothetical protein
MGGHLGPSISQVDVEMVGTMAGTEQRLSE